MDICENYDYCLRLRGRSSGSKIFKKRNLKLILRQAFEVHHVVNQVKCFHLEKWQEIIFYAKKLLFSCDMGLTYHRVCIAMKNGLLFKPNICWYFHIQANRKFWNSFLKKEIYLTCVEANFLQNFMY